MDPAWQRLDLYGPLVEVHRHLPSGRFRVRAAGARVEFGAEDREELEALLLALADVKRALTGDDFVPGKAYRARDAPDAEAGTVAVRLDPEDLDYLRTRVRVGKETSLDDALGRAVKAYMRDLLRRADDGEAEAPPRRAPAPAQRTFEQGPAAIGPIQRMLLLTALRRGHLTKLDVGRAYGITASRRNAASARTKAEGAVNALVARGLLRVEERAGERVWVLTETGRLLAEGDL